MGVQLSEECAELGEREETYILSTNLTSRGKKLLKLLIKKTRLIKIFEIYRDKVARSVSGWPGLFSAEQWPLVLLPW